MDTEVHNPKKQNRFRFSNIINWAKSLFRKKYNEPLQDKEENPHKDDRLQDIKDRLNDADYPYELFSVPERLQPDFKALIVRTVTDGFHDGVIGNKSAVYFERIRGSISAFSAQIFSFLSGEIKNIDKQIAALSQLVTVKKRQFKLHSGYLNYLEHYNKFNERGNTRGEFVFYSLLFLIIFIADIPLGVELIKRLFFLSVKEESAPLFPIGDHWDVFLTAIGISASSIYIKIWYDEFVGRKYGHGVISRKKFEEMFLDDNNIIDELSITEKSSISRHAMQVRITKIILLLFTVSIFVILGIFKRFAWLEGQSDENHPNPIPVNILTITLTSITLLFSIISGVCLSIALNALTNYTRLRDSKKESVEIEAIYLNEVKKLSVLEGQKCQIEMFVKNQSAQSEWGINCKNLLESYYETGFKEGLAEPGYFMRGLNFFERIIQWRENVIARKINANISK